MHQPCDISCVGGHQVDQVVVDIQIRENLQLVQNCRPLVLVHNVFHLLNCYLQRYHTIRTAVNTSPSFLTTIFLGGQVWVRRCDGLSKVFAMAGRKLEKLSTYFVKVFPFSLYLCMQNICIT